MPTVRRYAEEQQAIALIQWCRTYQRKYPELGLLIAIPNGGRRNPREAARLKACGVRAGVSDYFLPVSRPLPSKTPGGCDDWYNGLWLELKSPGGKLSTSQVEWLNLMRQEGYDAGMCTGWVEAARTIAKYLGLPEGVAP